MPTDSNPKIAVVWFRNDLRICDNRVLTDAIRTGLPVVGLFESMVFKKSHGENRLRFQSQTLAALKNSLQALNVEFHFVEDVAAAIHEISQQAQITWIGVHREVGPDEIKRERAVESLAKGLGAKFARREGRQLVDPTDLPFDIQETPDLFTTFRKVVEADFRVHPPLPAPNPATAKFEANFPGALPIEALEGGRFLGGEAEAWNRLNHYFWTTNRISIYKETRNGMLAEDDSSKFSPYLANGSISARSIYDELKRYESERTSNDSTYWLVFELLWRDFFWLQLAKYGSLFFKSSGILNQKIDWPNDDPLLEAWKQGTTGFPLVDAAMRELSTTGYTSNRSRQIVSNFFCKAMGLDWREGAKWFEQQLLDYDVASNYGNWMYQASVGNDAREFRVFDLEKQARTYDPNSEFVRHYVPEFSNAKGNSANVVYPKPILDFWNSVSTNRRFYESIVGTGSISNSRHGRNNRRIHRQ